MRWASCPAQPAPRDPPCLAAHMPYLEEGHVLAIVLFALLQVRAVDEGAALLRVAITCRDATRSARQPQPMPGEHLPHGAAAEGSQLHPSSHRRAATVSGIMLTPDPRTGDGSPCVPAASITSHTMHGQRLPVPRSHMLPWRMHPLERIRAVR